jgi:chromosome partitioning protein
MIIVIGGIKGGSGKTTIATNLTVMCSQKNKKVLLVDADEQKSSSDWSEHRETLGLESPWTTIQLTGSSVRSEVRKMEKHYDEIIIDTGGRDTTSQRASLTIADILIAPFQPRSLDIWTIGKLSSLIDEVKIINQNLLCYALLNRADFKGHDNNDSLDIINESDFLSCFKTIIGQRKAFSNAAAEGKGVVEMKLYDQKALREMEALYLEIFG